MRVALVVRRVEFVLATGLATPENARQLAVWWLILVSSPFVYVVCKASLSLSFSRARFAFSCQCEARLMMTTPKVTTTVFESTTDLRQSFVAAALKKKGECL